VPSFARRLNLLRSTPLPWVRGAHPLDRAYALQSKPKFQAGWGDESLLARFDQPRPFGDLPAPVVPAFGPARPGGPGIVVRDGTFRAPLAELLPPEVAIGHVRELAPAQGSARGLALVLPGSGEEGYKQRTTLFAPLVGRGFILWLLEGPFYGPRRGPGQDGAEVHRVSDQALLNLSTVTEARALLLGARAAQAGALAIGGYSMGAYMSQVAMAELPFPVGVAALAGGDSARDVYARSCLSLSIDFERLGQGDAEGAARRLGGFFHVSRSSMFPVPNRPEAAVIVGAERDGYVSGEETRALHRYWPGSELRWVAGGHISAVLTQRQALRQALGDALERAAP
jgi:hypothetical protein